MTLFRERPDLLPRYRAGHPDALRVVHARYEGPVRGYIARRARSSAFRSLAPLNSVDDAIQETFARAFSESARTCYDERYPYWPYLRAIATHSLADETRPSRRLILLEPNELDHEVEQRAELESGPQCELTLNRLRMQLERLPVELQQIYAERFVLEHSQDTTSVNLSVTRRHVRTLERRLSRTLRRSLTVP